MKLLATKKSPQTKSRIGENIIYSKTYTFRIDPTKAFGFESYVSRFDSRFSLVPFVFEEENMLDR